MWRGGIVARFSPAGDPITDVFTAWPDLALLDRMIVEATGSLPGGPVALEKARRVQLRALARTGLAGNDPLSVADVDAWLARAGVTSVAELLARPDVEPEGVVRVTFDVPRPVVDQPRLIPVTVALLVRDVDASAPACRCSRTPASCAAARAHRQRAVGPARCRSGSRSSSAGSCRPRCSMTPTGRAPARR